MQEMTAQMKSIQNQPKPNVSSSMDMSMSSAPQWFDMEAPGGVRVEEKPKVPTSELPPASEFRTPDEKVGEDFSSTPSGVAS
eukprot:10197296-Karenia_brevis.AAC.1